MTTSDEDAVMDRCCWQGIRHAAMNRWKGVAVGTLVVVATALTLGLLLLAGATATEAVTAAATVLGGVGTASAGFFAFLAARDSSTAARTSAAAGQQASRALGLTTKPSVCFSIRARDLAAVSINESEPARGVFEVEDHWAAIDVDVVWIMRDDSKHTGHFSSVRLGEPASIDSGPDNGGYVNVRESKATYSDPDPRVVPR